MRYLILFVAILLLSVPEGAISQSAATFSGRPARQMMGGTSSASGQRGGAAASGARPGMHPTASPQPATSAPTDAGFPHRLGTTVGLQAVPPVTAPFGVGNINHPGMQPLPTNVGAISAPPAGYPNINFPGGAPGMNNPPSMPPRWGGTWDGRFHGRDHRSFDKPHAGPGVVFYGVPYYVPYVVYTTEPAAAAVPVPVAPPGPYGSGAAVGAPAPSEPAMPSAFKTITLLAFKDHTIMAVTDYWLEGDAVCYDTSSGSRTCIPLDRLDLPLTQQLNRERNVRFVLEARP